MWCVPQVHEKIRADPVHKKKERKKPAETKKWKATKLTYEQRKQHLKVGLCHIAVHGVGCVCTS